MFSRRRIRAKVEPVGMFRKKVNDFKTMIEFDKILSLNTESMEITLFSQKIVS